MALQIAANLKNYKTLYVSGEESLQQIKLRAERIANGENNCWVLSETRLESILRNAESLNPDIIVIDSIQAISTERTDSSPGSVTQIRECTTEILKYAKENNKPAILIGHINKEGNLAGPKVLEHIVDTVLQFEGDRNHLYRIIRATKNRFGSTSELGIFGKRPCQVCETIHFDLPGYQKISGNMVFFVFGVSGKAYNLHSILQGQWYTL